MKVQGIARGLLGTVARIVILAGVPTLLLMTCHFPKGVSPKHVTPQIISESMIFFYPPEAYEKQLEGTVTLRIRVEKNGYVGEAEILKSSGYDILDNAAMSMARTARFMPGQVRGEKRDLWMTWPVVFELTSTPMPSLDLMVWQQKALEYQATTSSGNVQIRRIAQQNLFFHYIDLASIMADNRSIFPNRIIMEMVTPSIRHSWLKYQEVWPLAFVLFQDFITRFPDSEYIKEAKDHLFDYVVNEISLLKETATDGSPLAQTRLQLLNDLTRFFEEYYPCALKKNSTL